MKKVLIITYYWPPSGGSGVQRWLKFSKYFPEFGFQPIIYTPENPDFSTQDNSLMSDISDETVVLKKKIIEPYSLQRLLFKGSDNTVFGVTNNKENWKSKLSLWLRSNVFIPDPKLLWIKPSAKYLEKYIKENNIEHVITTGPPHSMHLIGLRLKKKLGTQINWLADFRDPWVEIDFFHHLPMSELVRNRHKELENKVLKNADRVIVIGEHMKNQFSDRTSKIEVITNGYDDFKSVTEMPLTELFTITHLGIINRDRNSELLWSVLKELCEESEEFKRSLKVQFIGQISPDTTTYFNTHLGSNFVHIPKVPHSEVWKYQVSTQVLLLLVNNVPNSEGIITGKIFEYLNAKRPILAIGPKQGDLANIINQTNSGRIVDFSDREGMKCYILDCFERYKSNQLTADSLGLNKYHRKSLTKDLAQVLSNL